MLTCGSSVVAPEPPPPRRLLHNESSSSQNPSPGIQGSEVQDWAQDLVEENLPKYGAFRRPLRASFADRKPINCQATRCHGR